MFLTIAPELADDTYATIGLEGPASDLDSQVQRILQLQRHAAQPITPYFLTNGATDLESTTLTGASFLHLAHSFERAAAGFGFLRVLIMQVTTAGAISGQINVWVFPLGDAASAQQQLSTLFDGAGTYSFTCIGGFCPTSSGCTVSTACNYDADATEDDGSCVISSPCLALGCTDPSACNFDPTAQFNDGSCDYLSCIGCQEPGACNYDENALSPGTCDFDSCAGCTSPAVKCNYDAEAVLDDGSCDFTSCLPLGCTDPTACNFDPTATIPDGSCEYLSCIGCQDPAACNYDEDALIAGSCDYDSCAGCTNPDADNS